MCSLVGIARRRLRVEVVWRRSEGRPIVPRNGSAATHQRCDRDCRTDADGPPTYDRRTMVIRSDFAFDDEPADLADEPETRANRAAVAGVVLLAIVIAIAVAVISPATPRAGSQAATAGSVALESAPAFGWQTLAPASGRLRPDYPSPMVLSTDRVCVGFERIDFDPRNRRPSIARCDMQRPGDLAVNEIRSIVSIKAGFDTWHFIEAQAALDSIEVSLADGEPMSGDRVFLAGTIGALRLENGRDLERIEWATPLSTFRCTPDPMAWRSSVFCTER